MKRKRYSNDFKEQLVKEDQEVGNALSVAKRHGISEKMLCRWIQDSKHKALAETDGNVKKVAAFIPSPQAFRQMEKENDTLKKLLGEKDFKDFDIKRHGKKNSPGLSDYLAKGNMPPRSFNGPCGNGISLKLTAVRSSEAISILNLSVMCSRKPV